MEPQEKKWKLTRMAFWDERKGDWVEWDGSNYGWKVPGKEDLDKPKDY